MKPLQGLTIVVASPGDVEDERNSIKKVAEELNKNIAGERSLHIDVVRWETDTYPGFHVDGPQAIIDKLLDIEDCDLLIGIFWIRFGTPTKDARSGTEHEIRKAYEAWKRNNHPRIMLYFNAERYSPKLEELDQWRQVLSFKREISQEALYWEYKGIDHFMDLVRAHLSQFIIHMSDLPQKTNAITTTAIKTPTSSSLSIEKQLFHWLEAKASNKEGTRDKYERVIAHYRDFLHKYDLDLNSEDEKIISSLVEQWAKSGMTKKVVSDATFNQRLAIVKSFYNCSFELGCLSKNPIEKVKRRKKKRNEAHDADTIFNLDTIVETISNGLKLIDRKTPKGKRDYALLSLLIATRCRSSEVGDLKCGDIQIVGNTVIVTWRNSKGEKGNQLQTRLSPDVSLALEEYLEVAYGNARPHDAPLLKAYLNGNRGRHINRATICNICNKYLRISNVEKIRQTLIALDKREGPKEVDKKLFAN